MQRSTHKHSIPEQETLPNFTYIMLPAALKEALQVGAGNAVNLTGEVDGYVLNQAKVLMPDRLQAFGNGLWTFSFCPEVDDFVMNMNRAAERAAP